MTWGAFVRGQGNSCPRCPAAAPFDQKSEPLSFQGRAEPVTQSLDGSLGSGSALANSATLGKCPKTSEPISSPGSRNPTYLELIVRIEVGSILACRGHPNGQGYCLLI